MNDRHYLFELLDEDTECTEILIAAENESEAIKKCEQLFGECELIEELSDEEAENTGLDEF